MEILRRIVNARNVICQLESWNMTHTYPFDSKVKEAFTRKKVEYDEAIKNKDWDLMNSIGVELQDTVKKEKFLIRGLVSSLKSEAIDMFLSGDLLPYITMYGVKFNFICEKEGECYYSSNALPLHGRDGRQVPTVKLKLTIHEEYCNVRFKMESVSNGFLFLPTPKELEGYI